jgi:hypothetical protein
MMQQRTLRRSRPRRFDIFFHAGKTLRLIGRLMLDRRVPIVNKFFFLATLAFLLILLFFPDLLGETILSAVLPVVGTVIGVPIDAGFDWMAFALLLVNMLRVFPADLVAEHYRDIFSK